MIVSKVLLRDLISNHIKQENGLNEVLQMTLNAMMSTERTAHLGQTCLEYVTADRLIR